MTVMIGIIDCVWIGADILDMFGNSRFRLCSGDKGYNIVYIVRQSSSEPSWRAYLTFLHFLANPSSFS